MQVTFDLPDEVVNQLQPFADKGITVPKKVFCTLRKFQVFETTIFR
ncbi:hypothetical protein [Nostoc sp. C110]